MRRLLLATALALLLTSAWASPADAAFGFREAAVDFTNEDGSPATQAGSHPFAMTTAFEFNTVEEEGIGFETPDGNIKDLKIEFPAGFAGNPTAMPYCSTVDLVAEDCPISSEVGVVDVQAGGVEFTRTGVYNMPAPPGVAAKIGFKALTVPVTTELGVSPDPPYNLIASVPNIPEVVPFFGSSLTVWGTPAEAAHDSERTRCGGSCSLNLPEKPFLMLPRSCPSALTTIFEMDSWELPGSWVSQPASTLGPTGCGKLGFGPRLSAQPTNRSAESPTGMDLEVNVSDEGIGNPKGAAQSDVQKAVVTLPEGVTANPSLAEGLATCSQEDLSNERLSAEPSQGCPQASKIGTLEAQTPILEGKTLKGSLFIAEPYKNRFGTLLALYATLGEPDLGIFLKLEGKVEPDPRTGQLVGTFEGLPQYPVSHFALHFREGGRSPLVTPPRCGEYQTKAELTPWANPSSLYPATASFRISSGVGGGPCPAGGVPPLNPGFEAGSINNAASTYSPFYLRLTRKDGEQDLTRFDAVLPPGVVGKAAGIPKCSNAAIAAAKAKSGLEELASPSCPAASQIGRTLAGAGVGPELTYVPGKVYLGGSFGGDPLSVVAITPAVAGPFDAGTVVVRQALNLDPNTGEVQIDGAHSDPIPHILKGIPLKVRDIRVYVDRQNFTLNATSCEPESARATIFGSFLDVFSIADDVPVSTSARYQAADCGNLGFKPKLSLKLIGGTKRGDHPALYSVVTYPYPSGPGYANIGRAVVTLPPTEFIDNAHISNPCTRVQFNAGTCPKSSVLGTAKAITPLLDEPLEGPVYFRSNGGERQLPDIVADLKGLFEVVLVGQVDSKVNSQNARLRTTFASVPDAPATKFILDLKGGKKGLLVNSANLCAKTRRAGVRLTGQNGKRHEFNPVIATGCSKKKSR
jgi:hypothetical protein